MNIILHRVYLKDKTLGRLTVKGEQICETIENPWRKNKRFISCIPEGRYRVLERRHPHQGMQLVLSWVPNREQIMLHPPSFSLNELQGCIATTTTSNGVVRYSKVAFTAVTQMIRSVRQLNKPVYIIIRSS